MEMRAMKNEHQPDLYEFIIHKMFCTKYFIKVTFSLLLLYFVIIIFLSHFFSCSWWCVLLRNWTVMMWFLQILVKHSILRRFSAFVLVNVCAIWWASRVPWATPNWLNGCKHFAFECAASRINKLLIRTFPYLFPKRNQTLVVLVCVSAIFKFHSLSSWSLPSSLTHSLARPFARSLAHPLARFQTSELRNTKVPAVCRRIS